VQTITSTIFVAATAGISEGIQQLLREVSRCTIVGQGRDSADISGQIKSIRPEVVLVHHTPPTVDAVQIIATARKNAAPPRFLVLLSDESHFWSVLQARADGYVVWPTTWLPTAIDTVIHGGVWLGPVISEYLLRGEGSSILLAAGATMTELPPLLESLSVREKQVLKLLLEGLTNRQIAEALGLSAGTIKVHVKHIFEKLKVEHRGQAIVKLAKMRAVT